MTKDVSPSSVPSVLKPVVLSAVALIVLVVVTVLTLWISYRSHSLKTDFELADNHTDDAVAMKFLEDKSTSLKNYFLGLVVAGAVGLLAAGMLFVFGLMRKLCTSAVVATGLASLASLIAIVQGFIGWNSMKKGLELDTTAAAGNAEAFDENGFKEAEVYKRAITHRNATMVEGLLGLVATAYAVYAVVSCPKW